MVRGGNQNDDSADIGGGGGNQKDYIRWWRGGVPGMVKYCLCNIWTAAKLKYNKLENNQWQFCSNLLWGMYDFFLGEGRVY